MIPPPLSVNRSFSRNLEVTDSLLKNFGNISLDFHPLHIDEAYAREKGFKGRVAYGNILGFMVSALIGENLKEYELMLISQSINYKKPVYLGDTINLKGVIKDNNEVLRVVNIKLLFINQKGETCASGNCMVKYLNEY